GLAVREVLDAEGLKPVTAETQRILYLAQEQQK
ncbi:MAG TPA: SAM-dependent methyltransferase, partial [Lachnospiraceae bacterium]|nr:SAM-dependent methyltransferase [Lachnospiraceae bacterium]